MVRVGDIAKNIISCYLSFIFRYLLTDWQENGGVVLKRLRSFTTVNTDKVRG